MISDIKEVLLEIAAIVSSASFAIEGLEWDVTEYAFSRSENARDFWDCFGEEQA
jgi:hypothetical protein